MSEPIIRTSGVCFPRDQVSMLYVCSTDDMLSNNENVSDWNGDRSYSQYVSFVRINCNTGAQYLIHYGDVIMGTIASQITSLTIVFSTVLFRRRSKKTSKLRVTGLCAGNSPGTGEFPAQMASIAENVSLWWLHHVTNHTRDAQWGLCDRRSPTVALILIWKKRASNSYTDILNHFL